MSPHALRQRVVYHERRAMQSCVECLADVDGYARCRSCRVKKAALMRQRRSPMHVPLQFRYDCDGLVAAVKRAAAPSDSDFAAYMGSKTEYAVTFARLVMRKARRLGLLEDERVFPQAKHRKAS